MLTLRGGCHCEQVLVEFSTAKALPDLQPRACQCGFCRRHAAAMISDPQGLLTITTTCDETLIYRFGLGITDFHMCARCGVFVAATWQDNDGAVQGVVNIHALLPEAPFEKPTPVSFDGEGLTDRE
jgi:hypothetical protein